MAQRLRVVYVRAVGLILLGFAPCLVACRQARTCNGRPTKDVAAAAPSEALSGDAWRAAFATAPKDFALDAASTNLDADGPHKARVVGANEGPVSVSGSHITLQRTALGQAFLLSPTLVLASNTPIIDHGQPLVVHFAQAQDRLALFAENNAAVYRGLPTRRLLQTFAIEEEDEGAITFRWDFGLQSIDQRMPMAYSDWPASLDAYVESESNVLPVDDAYLADAHVRGDTLVLHQIARVRRTPTPLDMWGILQGGFESYPIEATVNVYFTLAPLTDNAHFVRKLSTRQRDIGYFEVATMRDGDGGLDAWATRLDVSPERGPIRFAITDDVPDDLLDAVREGVLYWNRALGRDILQVVTGVQSDRMPDEREVVVHWIDWRKAGFARASLQPHPLTGEILRADIYLTSSFAEVGAERVVDALVPEMPAQAQAPWQKALGQSIVPQGFAGAPKCAYASAASAVVRSSLLDTHANKERIRRAVADNIRLVVAHEVGHTLGLRHNFGASSQSEIVDQQSQAGIWQAYLSDEAHTGAATATSVMDYLGGADGFLLGAHIRDHALAYDVAAMAWGYAPTPVYSAAKDVDAPIPDAFEIADADADTAPLLFCTDIERIDDLVGCAAHDSGRNPLAGHLAQALAARQAMPRWILNRFIDGLHPEYAGDRKSPQHIVEAFSFDRHAQAIAFWGQATFQALQDPTRVLAVERNFGHLRHLDPKAYKNATRQQLAAWLDEIGGLPGFLLTVLHAEAPNTSGANEPTTLDVGWLEDEVLARIDAPGFADGHTAQGRAYHLDRGDLVAIRDLAPKVAAHLEQSVLRDVIATLTGAAPGTRDPELQTIWSVWVQALAATAHLQSELVRPEWQDSLGGLASIILMQEEGRIEGTKDGAPLSVGAPRFREDVRLAAVRLLSPVVFGTPSWLEAQRSALHKRLRDRLLHVAVAEAGPLGLRLAGLYTGPEFVIPVDVSPELRHWAETEMRVLDALRKAQDSSVWRGVADTL